MSLKNNPESDAADGSVEPNVDAEDVRDFFLAEDEPLGVSDISQEFNISDDEAREHLERLVQSGIVRKHARRKTNGGSVWTLEYPQLRVRSEKEVAGESSLAYRVNLSGEPRDEEVGIEDALELLADFEDNRADLSTAQAAVKLQATPRHVRDLLDDLVDRGIAGRREVEPVAPGAGAANSYWLADAYSTDDVEQLLHDPEPDAVDQLNDALSG